MADPVADGAADHARHDPLVIAASIGRAVPATAVLAQAVACLPCGRLRGDLTLLAEALPTLAVPARPREYVLSAALAARLRRRGLRALLDRVATARDAITRPLAVGFTTLGLAGLLLAATPTGWAGGASGAAPEQQRLAAPTHAVASAVGDVTRSHGTPGAAQDPLYVHALLHGAPDGRAGGPSPMALLSASFLGVGAGLFALRRLAPRYRVR